MKIAGASLNQIPLDWDHNIHNILTAIEQAKAQGVDFLCFPELSITGYGCEDMFLSEWVSDKALEMLSLIRPHTQGITIAVGLPIWGEKLSRGAVKGVFNCVALVQNGEYLGITAKQFMAIDGVHYEFRWFTPWPRFEKGSLIIEGQEVEIGDLTYHIKGIHIGFEICEDAWRGPSRPGYELCNRAVQLICNPSASHFAMQKTFERLHLVLNSSADFNCGYLYVNMLGNEAGRMIYDGEIIIAQKGTLMAQNRLLSYRDCNILAVEMNPETGQIRKGEIHTPLDKNQEFVQAASLGLFDYMRKSKSKGFALSLSGGADSATCAVLIAEMVNRGCAELGTETFLQKAGLSARFGSQVPDYKTIMAEILSTAYQATENSSETTLNAAKAVAEEIGARFYSWSIQQELETMRNTMEQQLGRSLIWERDDIALQNIQARLRSPLIWMMANIESKLLITTSNRSEGDVGYSTMDGDSSGSIAPIAGVSKHFIIQWLKWAQKNLGYRSLAHITALPPTAELRPPQQSQSDEKDLMPYEVMEMIERLAIAGRKSPQQVYDAMKKHTEHPPAVLLQWVKKFYSLWSRNQWKRERTAPSFHLDDFNIDPKTWHRFPILNSGFQKELDELR